MLPDSISTKLSLMNDMQFMQVMGTGEYRKFVRFLAFYRVELNKILIFYTLKRNNIGNTFAAILNKVDNKWTIQEKDINLTLFDLNKDISKSYFPTNFFVQNLNTNRNQFAKLILYPENLQYGISSQVHISNFSMLNNLSLYLIIGKFKLDQ